MSTYITSKGQGKELFLIHGIMSDHSFFDNLVSELENDYKLTLIDRAGYGANEKEEGADYSIEAQAERTAEIIQSITNEPICIVAHSAGGIVALQLVLKHPELVSELVLVETPITVTKEDRARMDEWNAELNTYAAQKKHIKAIAAFHREIGSDSKSKPQKKVTSDSLKRVMKNLDFFMTGELNYIQRFVPDVEKLKMIDIPLCMFLTEGKPDSIYAKAARNAAAICGWETQPLEGVHNVIEYAPKEFVQKLKFLLDTWRKQ